jgi:hypothetical protein
MRKPRKAILIRLAIYVPLLSYFGWRAYEHLQAERAAERAQQEQDEQVELADPFEGMPTKTIDVDGKKVKVYEITPEQAEAYLGVDTAAGEGTGAEDGGETSDG